MTVETKLPKRPRGRPAGSGKPDDAILDRIADLMVADPALKATTAAKRIVKNISTAHLRRLQVKWKSSDRQRLTAAGERARQQEHVRTRQTAAVSPHKEYGSVFDRMMGLNRAIDGLSWMKDLQAMQELPFMKQMRAIQAIQNPPWMQHMRAMQDSPLMKQIQVGQDLYRDVISGPVKKLPF
jgi:hypothetical protein